MIEEIKHFVQTLIHSLNPKWYTNIVGLKTKKTITHMVLVLVFSMVIMGILFLPFVLNASSAIKKDLSAFSEFRIRGSVNMTRPIIVPANDPELIIDLNGGRTFGDEKLLVTKEYVYFQPVGKALRINVKKLLNPLDYKTQASSFLALFFIAVIPALLLFLFLMFALKYALLIGLVFAITYFIFRVLLLYKISPRRAFNLVAYSATLMIFLEIVFIPLNGKILVPLFQLFFLDFYLIPILIFVGYTVAAFWLVETKTPSESKSSEWQF